MMISASASALKWARATFRTASSVVSSTKSQAVCSAFGFASTAAGSRERMLLNPSFSKVSRAPSRSSWENWQSFRSVSTGAAVVMVPSQ